MPDTMNLMTLDGYQAKIEYDPDIDMFRGEILGLNGGADFYGKNPDELRKEFSNSLKYVRKREYLHAVTILVNLIFVSLLSFTKDWLLLQRQKVKASIY